MGDLLEANKVVKRVNTDQISIFFPVLTGDVYLECYSDASIANF